jgi:S1-C subfamily serine protease
MADAVVREKRSKRSINVLALAFASFALTACMPGDDAPLDQESRTIAVEQNATPTGANATGSVTHLLPKTGPTYVTLTITKVDKFQGSQKEDGSKSAIASGSGFIADGSGYVLTAAHVAHEKGYLVSARAANGRIYSGKVIDVNPQNDMALIKLRGYVGKAVTPAPSNCVAKGSLVFSLGRPHERGDLARVGTLDSMRFGRPVSYGKFGYPEALVLDMSTQKGESGGPLFNGNGQLIGMVVSTLSDQSGRPINLAHAVYASSLAQFFCARTQCSDEWALLARSSPEGCPNY